MSQFTTPLQVEIANKGKRKFKLITSFEYHVGIYPSKEVIQIPVGFKTDFASIPKIFWFILEPIGTYGKAAVLHDWLYDVGIYSRKKSDKIFNEAMIILNTKKWKRKILYYSVRLIGWYRWNKLRKI